MRAALPALALPLAASLIAGLGAKEQMRLWRFTPRPI